MSNQKTEGRYKVEVNTAGDPPDSWAGNALRWDTVQEALDYGLDLALRWTAVRDYRVFDTETETVVER